jgi:hypothetical protein
MKTIKKYFNKIDNISKLVMITKILCKSKPKTNAIDIIGIA